MIRCLFLLLSCFCWDNVVRANIIEGFATREVPSLEEIPNIAEQVRNLSAKRLKANEHEEIVLKDRKLKSKSESKQKKNDVEPESEPAKQTRQADDENRFPFIPEAPPEFNEAGELSFVIVSQTFSRQGHESSFACSHSVLSVDGRISLQHRNDRSRYKVCFLRSIIDGHIPSRPVFRNMHDWIRHQHEFCVLHILFNFRLGWISWFWDSVAEWKYG